MLLFVVLITQTGVPSVHVGTTNGKVKDANSYNGDPEIVKTSHEWYQLQKAEEVRGITLPVTSFYNHKPLSFTATLH